MSFKPTRGTHDLFGKNKDKHNTIIKKVSSLAEIFSFKEIETPVFETTELFAKPLGELSDVVLKEMYSFVDKNEDSLTLRPEYTTPMIRAAISNNLLNNLPCKLFGVGPMFRRERPQKGRYRQFNQINFENLGTEDIFADVELIILAHKLLEVLIPNVKCKLYINSLGDKSTLDNYKKELTNFFINFKNDLSISSKQKIETNPLRILDSKDKLDQSVIESAPLIINFLSKEALKKYDELKNLLNTFNIKFEEKNSLVRGLDYYCHTVFEFKTESLGSQDTIIGGGRYDGLIKILGGKDIPGVGWAGGVERIIMLMADSLIKNETIHFAILNESYKSHALLALKALTDNKFLTYWNYKYNLKKSLAKSNELKASHIIIIGEEEYKKKKYTIKNLNDGKQKSLNLNEIITYLKHD